MLSHMNPSPYELPVTSCAAALTQGPPMQALLSAISGPVRGYDRLEELEARSVSAPALGWAVDWRDRASGSGAEDGSARTARGGLRYPSEAPSRASHPGGPACEGISG